MLVYDTLEQYSVNSPLNKYNAAFKMAVSLLSAVFVLALNNIAVSIYVLVMSVIINIAVGKVNLRDYLRLNGAAFYFIIASTVALAVDISSVEVAERNINLFGFYFYVTGENIYKAIKITLNAEAVINAVYFTSLSTSIWEITDVLRKLKVPESIVFIMDMTYRFIFVLYDTYNGMTISSKSRMGEKNFYSQVRSFGYKASGLFLLSLSKADKYYDSLVSRGYKGGMSFFYEKKPVERNLVLFSVLYFVLLLIVFWVGGVIGG